MKTEGYNIKCPHCGKDILLSGEPYDDGYLRVYPDRYAVYTGEKGKKLTAKEYTLLFFLMDNSPRVLTHKQILQCVWGWEYQDDIDYVRIYIWHLRHKIEKDPQNPEYLKTLGGIGYYFKKRD